MLKKTAIATLAALCLAGTAHATLPVNRCTPETVLPDSQAKIQQFSFAYTAPSAEQTATFQAARTPDGIYFTTRYDENGNGYRITRKADEQLLTQLDALLKQHSANQWNENHTQRLDRTTFTLKVRYDDNTQIFGSCYADIHNSIEALRQDLVRLRTQAIQRYPDTWQHPIDTDQ